MADAIFISYRRDDSEGEAGRLFDDLTRAFGDDTVFMDVAGIKPGVDFRRAIEDNVASCGVFLAIVGPTWISIENAEGERRLKDPNDFVALEIVSALKREVPVIPVLVHDAKMPAASLLPESLQSFAFRNSVELSHARWNSDVALLVEALKAYVTPKAAAAEEPVHATVPVQLPAPHHPSGTAVPDVVKKNWLPAILGAAAGILLLIVVIVYWATRPGSSESGASTAGATKSAIAPASQASTPRPSPSPDPNAAYIGTWRRTGGKGDSDALGELVISASGSGLLVHAYGKCETPACDWGSQPGVVSAYNVVATFSPSPSGEDISRTATVTVHPAAEGLNVVIHNTFESQDGKRTNDAVAVFTNAK